jgi:biopolymer transport protein ExbB
MFLTEQIADIMERGGWVMWPLLTLSIVSVALSLERWLFWLATRRQGQPTRLARMAGHLRAGRVKELKELVHGDRSVYGRVVRGLVELGMSEAVGVEMVEGQRRRIERFMVILSTIITAAPLLGILGTVSGVIDSFRILSETDVVTDPNLVAGGIAEALLTTGFGLIVALITLFPYMVFRASVERCLGSLEALIAAAENGRREG